jgi:hypothetical protein
MAVDPASPEMAALRKWLHDANNRLGVILTTAELLQFEELSAGAAARRQTIEDSALEIRRILREISVHYFS